MIVAVILIALACAVGFVGVAAKIASARSKRTAGAARPSSRGRAGADSRHQTAESVRQQYRYADDNGLLLCDNTMWAIFHMQGLTDDLQTTDDVQSLSITQAEQLNAFAQNGDQLLDLHQIVTNRPFDGGQWEQRLLQHSFDPTPLWKAYVHRWRRQLDSTGAAQPAAYLAVRLGTLTAGSVIRAAPLPMSVNPTGQRASVADLAAGRLVDIAEETLTPEQIAAWQTVADYVVYSLPSWGLTPATRQETVRLIREPWYGDLPIPGEAVIKTRPWGPGDFDLVLETSGYNRGRYVLLTPGDVDAASIVGEPESYTATLVATDWPADTVFSKQTAWMRHAMRINPAVRISDRITLIPPDEFSRRINKEARDLIDEVNDISRANRARFDRHDAAPEDLVPEKMMAQMQDAAELATYVKENRVPGVEHQPLFHLSAASEDELNRAIAGFTLEMFHIGITVEAPKKMQLRLLQSRCPGNPPKATIGMRQWGRLTESEMITGGLAASTSDVGDQIEVDRGVSRGWIGPPIGYSMTTGQPIFYSNFVQMARNRGAGVAIIGASGNGKSNLMMLLFFQDSESGATTSAIDPKGDIAAFCYYLAFGNQMLDPQFNIDADAGTLGTDRSRFQPVNRRFWDETQITDVTRARNGALDVFNTAPDIETARQRAETVLQLLMTPADWHKTRGVITEAMTAMLAPFYRDVAAAQDQIAADGDADGTTVAAARAEVWRTLPGRPTMWSLRQKIAEMAAVYAGDGVTGDDAAAWRTARSLMDQIAGDGRANPGMPMARLLFSQTPTSGFDTSRRRRTVYTISGVSTPAPDTPQESWKPAQRAAAAVMFVITAICTDALDDHTKQPKGVYVDEMHVLTALEEGRGMVIEGLRKGRSWNGAMVVASQQATDLQALNAKAGEGKADTNQVPTVFAFGQGPNESGTMADVLQAHGEKNTVLVRQLQRLSTGRCVMRDSGRDGGRLGPVEVDMGFTELFCAADTTATTFPLSHSWPVSDDPANWTQLTPETMQAAMLGAPQDQEGAA